MTEAKRVKLLPEMEGVTARWYARQRGTAAQRAGYRRQAAELVDGLAGTADVLEVAPGPGYLAIEIARLGHRVTGLDVSRTMVDLASGQAREDGCSVDFRCGDVAAMPFADEAFDMVVCQAAFKNFARPVSALDEMHRVLRPGGTAVIQDMNRDASLAEVDDEVAAMELGRCSALAVRWVLAGLRRRAYSPARFRRLVAASAFGTCDIRTEGISLDVRLAKDVPT